MMKKLLVAVVITLSLAVAGVAQRGGRGGPPQGPLVAPGRYHAQLGHQAGTEVTPLGQSQSFLVVPLER